MSTRRLAGILWAVIFSTNVAYSQGAREVVPPHIVTAAMGEATTTPDRGIIQFAIETRATSAAVAGTDNAQKQRRIIDAIRSRGIPTAKITTSGYFIGPEERFDSGQRTIIGYVSRNSIVVDVERVEAMGSIIDAALSAGASSVGSLDLYSSHFDEDRREALRQAVVKARADAEVMAKAAGGSLGALIELQVNDGGAPRPMFSALSRGVNMVAAAAVETPVSVGTQKITVSISAQWVFQPSPR